MLCFVEIVKDILWNGCTTFLNQFSSFGIYLIISFHLLSLITQICENIFVWLPRFCVLVLLEYHTVLGASFISPQKSSSRWMQERFDNLSYEEVIKMFVELIIVIDSVI